MPRVSIGSSPDHQNPKRRFLIEVIAEVSVKLEMLRYSVAAKDFPDKLPAGWNDPEDDDTYKTITWLSNFALVDQNGKALDKMPDGEFYRINIPKGPKYVYLDGSTVKKLDTSDIGAGPDRNKVSAIIRQADPPIGRT
jgi:hypothetical protein